MTGLGVDIETNRIKNENNKYVNKPICAPFDAFWMIQKPLVTYTVGIECIGESNEMSVIMKQLLWMKCDDFN